MRDAGHRDSCQRARHEDGRCAPHYSIARAYDHQCMIPVIQMVGVSNSTVAIAEFTICALFRTWHPYLVDCNFFADEHGAASLRHKALISELFKICDEAFFTSGFGRLHGVGCNWKCPLDDIQSLRREFLMTRSTIGKRVKLSYQTTAVVSKAVSTKGNSKEQDNGFSLHFRPKTQEGLSPNTTESNHLEFLCYLDRQPGLQGLRHGLPK